MCGLPREDQLVKEGFENVGEVVPLDRRDGETVAPLQYMVNHNAAHANELAQLGRKLTELGNREAGEQVLAAVSEFEKGNLRLSAVLASLK